MANLSSQVQRNILAIGFIHKLQRKLNVINTGLNSSSVVLK